MNFNPNNNIKKLKLIICRHGQSIWNKENKFTGWTNINLTNYGIQQSIKTAHVLQNNIIPNKIISSKLIRSIHSAEIIRNKLKIEKNISTFEELNERHYGMLEGINRNEASQKYGHSNMNNIRQDFHLLPYIMNNKPVSVFHNQIKNIYNINEFGEANQHVYQRLLSLWNNYIIKQLIKHEILLIISHKNTLRCLMKIIENLNNLEFKNTNIENNELILYNFDKNLNFINKLYIY